MRKLLLKLLGVNQRAYTVSVVTNTDSGAVLVQTIDVRSTAAFPVLGGYIEIREIK